MFYQFFLGMEISSDEIQSFEGFINHSFKQHDCVIQPVLRVM